jgi:DNA-binding transcriptional ArsR family regulator
VDIQILEQGVPEKWAGMAAVFTAIGDDCRQRILLAFDAEEHLSIHELCGHLPVSRTAAVHHLHALEAAGLLIREKVGRETQYRINPAPIREAALTLLEYLDSRLAPKEQHL